MDKEYISCNHSKLMISIEKLVEDILNRRVDWSKCSQEFKILIKEFDHQYNPSLKYSVYQTAFYKLFDKSRVNGSVDYSKINALNFKQVQDYFASYVRIKECERKAFILSEQHNKERLCGYIEDLINHYSKLLFVRIDLAYLKEHHNKIDIQTFKNNIQQMIGYIQDGDTCFKYIEGYAWALEQGEEKGYHCHLLLIYDGARRKSDYYYGQRAIERWKRITKDQGYGFNCNTSEHKDRFLKYEKLGIGLIHRDNLKEVENAKSACSYLVKPEKTDQALLVKVKNMRTFGTGNYKRSYRRYGGK